MPALIGSPFNDHRIRGGSRLPGHFAVPFLAAVLLATVFAATSARQGRAEDAVDLGEIREQHTMIPMRDGKRLSAYLYFPPGEGPWPGVFEQRYASLRGKSTRLGAARLAAEGYVVALVNFRGTHESEGTWVGYRIGGTTRPDRFKSLETVCRDPEDNRRLLVEWFRHPRYDAYWQSEDCTRQFDRMNVPVVSAAAPSEHAGSTPAPPQGGETASDPLQTMRRKLQAGDEVRVVCFGDSVTGVYYHTGSRRAYTDMLGIALEKAFPRVKVRMFNAGISGHTTANGLERIDRDVIRHKPDLVTVMFGLNDMTRVPLAEYARNLRTIVQRCRSAGAEVVLATPNNVLSTPARPSDKLIQYCDAVREVGRDMGVPVCDCYRQLEAERQRDAWSWRLLMSDAIHPNMDGHKRIAEQLARCITGRLVSLRDVKTPTLAIPRTRELLRSEKPIRVLAMPPLDQWITPVIRAAFPEATLQVTSWPTEGKSLRELELDSGQRVRSFKPDLVLIAVPRTATADSDEQFAASFAWIMNWSLNFGPPTWDCVVVHPDVVKPVVEPRGSESATKEPVPADRDRLVRRLVHAQDLPLVDRAPGNTAAPSDLVRQWFHQQIRSEE